MTAREKNAGNANLQIDKAQTVARPTNEPQPQPVEIEIPKRDPNDPCGSSPLPKPGKPKVINIPEKPEPITRPTPPPPPRPDCGPGIVIPPLPPNPNPKPPVGPKENIILK